MASLQSYAVGYISVDGKTLVEETSMTIEKKSGLNPVLTVIGGFAGMSQGATTAEISIDSAVPTRDFEFNPDRYMRLGSVVEVTIQMAGRLTTCKGYITESSYSHSVGDAAKLSMKLMCRFEDFE
jgi:hypothetical protein